jgi:hypothetical protein
MSIEEICVKYGISNYTINDDGSVDVDGDVDLNDCELTELPLTFNKVTGTFNCDDNKLTDLKGCPKSVGVFFCGSNNLTDLEFSPEKVGGDFHCFGNKLTSLKGCPESIGGDFTCTGNNLTSLKGCPKNIGQNFNADGNNIIDLIETPESLKGYMKLHYNPIESVIGSEVAYIEFLRAFNTFKIIKDGVVNLKRLKYVMEIFDKPINIEEILKYYKIK